MIRVGRVERYTWYLLRVFDRFDRFAVARLILGHVDIRSIRCKRAPVLADLTYGEERAREGRERERERGGSRRRFVRIDKRDSKRKTARPFGNSIPSEKS